MISRDAQQLLPQLASYYPVIAVTGPRQSGKTTLVKAVFAGKPYVNLETPDNRELARTDPRAFLSRYPDGAIFDEAQRVPDLFSWLQERVDADGRSGLFVLTGSQQFGLHSGITQSLAGRVGIVHLAPFSLSELVSAGRAPASLEDMLWRGFYPPVHDRAIPPHLWYADYLATYVERDVRQMLNVRDLVGFQRFVRLCAGRTAQILNLSALAADCGITHNTAASWLSLLEASYLVVRLAPYFRNYGKRLVKSPKLYFLDAGFAAWLSGIRAAKEIETSAQRGALFETWLVSEFGKWAWNHRRPEQMYFWRDNHGTEVDLLVERGEALACVECKTGQTVASDWFGALKSFGELSGARRAFLVYGGSESSSRGDVKVVPWRQIGDVFKGIEDAFDGTGPS